MCNLAFFLFILIFFFNVRSCIEHGSSCLLRKHFLYQQNYFPSQSPPNCAFKVEVVGETQTKQNPVLFGPIMGCWYFRFPFSHKKHCQVLGLWVQVDGDLVLTLLTFAL